MSAEVFQMNFLACWTSYWFTRDVHNGSQIHPFALFWVICGWEVKSCGQLSKVTAYKYHSEQLASVVICLLLKILMWFIYFWTTPTQIQFMWLHMTTLRNINLAVLFNLFCQTVIQFMLTKYIWMVFFIVKYGKNWNLKAELKKNLMKVIS